MRAHTLFLIAAVSGLALAACSPQTQPEAQTQTDAVGAVAAASPSVADMTAPHADAGPAVYFVNLKDGDTVSSPFRVVFGVYGKGVAPAGTEKENTGHHHLLIDTELTAEEMTFAIPNDETHKHFGGGQTETVLTLPPGQHTLQLDFGDLKHEQLDPPMLSKKITVTVE